MELKTGLVQGASNEVHQSIPFAPQREQRAGVKGTYSGRRASKSGSMASPFFGGGAASWVGMVWGVLTGTGGGGRRWPILSCKVGFTPAEGNQTKVDTSR